MISLQVLPHRSGESQTSYCNVCATRRPVSSPLPAQLTLMVGEDFVDLVQAVIV